MNFPEILISERCENVYVRRAALFSLYIVFSIPFFCSPGFVLQPWPQMQLHLAGPWGGFSRVFPLRKKKVQKNANLVDLEKCCKVSIWLQKPVLIQPTTSLPKFLRNGGSKLAVSGVSFRGQFPAPCHSPPLRQLKAHRRRRPLRTPRNSRSSSSNGGASPVIFYRDSKIWCRNPRPANQRKERSQTSMIFSCQVWQFSQNLIFKCFVAFFSCSMQIL